MEYKIVRKFLFPRIPITADLLPVKTSSLPSRCFQFTAFLTLDRKKEKDNFCVSECCNEKTLLPIIHTMENDFT